MITVTNIINAKLRLRADGSGRGKSRHMVKVEITGRADMDRLADSVARNGGKRSQALAQSLRTASRFEFTLPADQWAKLEKEAAA